MLRLGVFFTLAMVAPFGQSGCPHSGDHLLSTPTKAHYESSAVYDDSLERKCEPNCQVPARDQLSCDNQYRTFDGTCNNLAHPYAGSRNECHERLLPAEYADGISKPLPRADPVLVFNALQSLDSRNASPFTIQASLINQFIAHDLTATALSEVHDPGDCCSKKHANAPQCSMRIDVSHAKGYEDLGVKCMSFFRAARCPHSTGARQSRNTQTAYLDLSHIYLDGSVRDRKRPWLLADTISETSGELPPVGTHKEVCYEGHKRCFRGDGRMNQQQGLSMHHVVFIRLHNRSATKFRQMHPSWDAEKVFQEARKLTIGRYQYFIYKELVPTTVENQTLYDNGIHISQLVAGTKHNSSVRTVTHVEFIHAAFRLHVHAPELFGDEEYTWWDPSTYFNTPDYPKKLFAMQWRNRDRAVFPMARSMAQDVFKPPYGKIGFSMALLNIQRGRDVGLPSFKAVAEWAYGTPINSYDDLEKLNIFTAEIMTMLKYVYPNVGDIDLWVGVHNVVRPTQKQSGIMQKLRVIEHHGQVYGDRFFFSHEGVFTQEQRTAIAKSSTYSQIICETLDVDEVPLNSFVFSTELAHQKCSDLPPFDYTPWMNQQ